MRDDACIVPYRSVLWFALSVFRLGKALRDLGKGMLGGIRRLDLIGSILIDLIKCRFGILQIAVGGRCQWILLVFLFFLHKKSPDLIVM